MALPASQADRSRALTLPAAWLPVHRRYIFTGLFPAQTKHREKARIPPALCCWRLAQLSISFGDFKLHTTLVLSRLILLHCVQPANGVSVLSAAASGTHEGHPILPAAPTQLRHDPLAGAADCRRRHHVL